MFQFYDEIFSSDEDYLAAKYGYQRIVDQYVAKGMDWEEAHTRAMAEKGFSWWGEEKYGRKHGLL